MDKFTHGYVVCALWSSNDDGDEPLDRYYDIDDLAPETLARVVADCEKFQRENAALLAQYAEQIDSEQVRAEGGPMEWAGHDFWLTRNGHGAGFWDRGLDDLGEQLSDACKKFGEVWLYVGDDGKVHIE